MRKRRKTRGMRPRPPSQHDRLGSNGNDSSASPTDRGGFLFVELPWVFLVVACVALPAHFAQFRDALESLTGWSKPHVSGFLGVVLFFIVVLAGLPILLAPVKSSFDWREFSSKCGLLYYSLVMAMWKAVGETGKYALVGGLVFTLVSAVYIASKQGRGFAAWYSLVFCIAFVSALMLAVGLPVEAIATETRELLNFNISRYVLNPPLVAATLVMPYSFLSLGHLSGRNGRNARWRDSWIYVVFIITMMVAIPPTVDTPLDAWQSFPGGRFWAIGGLIGLYAGCVFIALETLRPPNWIVTPIKLLRLVAAHVFVLMSVTAAIGVLIWRSAGSLPAGIILGHAAVGLSIGLVLPVWYSGYEFYLLPHLRKRIAGNAAEQP